VPGVRNAVKQRWKGIVDGGFTQIVYSVIAAIVLCNLAWVSSIDAALGVVVLTGVVLWAGWSDQ
jgi:hypothetical protein